MPKGVYERTPEARAANSEGHTGVSLSPKTRAAMSAAHIGVPLSPETCAAMSVARKGVPLSPEHCAALSTTKKGVALSPEHCAAISAARQGVSFEDWTGFISFNKYCPKFNEKLKQQVRDKYNNCDYMSGLPATICNPHRKLDVHHVDYNKQQGCDDHEWRLIPLSRKNHAKTNRNRSFWNCLFTYALQYDETYYEDLDEVIALDEFEIGVITI